MFNYHSSSIFSSFRSRLRLPNPLMVEKLVRLRLDLTHAPTHTYIEREEEEEEEEAARELSILYPLQRKNRLMIHLGSDTIGVVFKDAAGVAGNIFAFGLFISPIPTFRRIIRNRSTEQFSGLPYVYALLNCLICLWYGTPLVSSNNVLVMTVNATGSVFQLVYIILFITHAEKEKKVRMFGLLSGEVVLFVIIVVGSLQIHDLQVRQIVVGVVSGISLISMLASPLFIISLVIRTRSVEFMPFYLSLSTFLMSASFFLYGILNSDIFIYLPNGIGALLGITQLVLYCYYKNSGAETASSPLIETHS